MEPGFADWCAIVNRKEQEAHMENSLPEYVSTPLQGFIDYTKESTRLLHMSMQGMSMITKLPQAVKVLEKTDHAAYTPEEALKRKEQYGRELEAIEAQAEFADRELKHGFPLLHAHTLVGLWGALEAALEDLVVGMLMNEPDLLRSELFSKVRVPLAEFESLEKEQRMRLLVEEVGRGHGLGKKAGVDGFETLLASVGLSGGIDAEIKKIIWEVSHVRNVIVHRGSVADRRLVESCPWMSLKAGGKITVAHEALWRYEKALVKYLTTVIYRARARYGKVIKGSLRRCVKNSEALESIESCYFVFR